MGNVQSPRIGQERDKAAFEELLSISMSSLDTCYDYWLNSLSSTLKADKSVFEDLFGCLLRDSETHYLVFRGSGAHAEVVEVFLIFIFLSEASAFERISFMCKIMTKNGTEPLNTKTIGRMIGIILGAMKKLCKVDIPDKYTVSYFLSTSIGYFKVRMSDLCLEELEANDDDSKKDKSNSSDLTSIVEDPDEAVTDHILSQRTDNLEFTTSEFWDFCQDIHQIHSYVLFPETARHQFVAANKDTFNIGDIESKSSDMTHFDYERKKHHAVWDYTVADMVDNTWMAEVPILSSKCCLFTALEHLILSTNKDHEPQEFNVIPVVLVNDEDFDEEYDEYTDSDAGSSYSGSRSGLMNNQLSNSKIKEDSKSNLMNKNSSKNIATGSGGEGMGTRKMSKAGGLGRSASKAGMGRSPSKAGMGRSGSKAVMGVGGGMGRSASKAGMGRSMSKAGMGRSMSKAGMGRQGSKAVVGGGMGRSSSTMNSMTRLNKNSPNSKGTPGSKKRRRKRIPDVSKASLRDESSFNLLAHAASRAGSSQGSLALGNTFDGDEKEDNAIFMTNVMGVFDVSFVIAWIVSKLPQHLTHRHHMTDNVQKVVEEHREEEEEKKETKEDAVKVLEVPLSPTVGNPKPPGSRKDSPMVAGRKMTGSPIAGPPGSPKGSPMVDSHKTVKPLLGINVESPIMSGHKTVDSPKGPMVPSTTKTSDPHQPHGYYHGSHLNDFSSHIGNIVALNNRVHDAHDKFLEMASEHWQAIGKEFADSELEEVMLACKSLSHRPKMSMKEVMTLDCQVYAVIELVAKCHTTIPVAADSGQMDRITDVITNTTVAAFLYRHDYEILGIKVYSSVVSDESLIRKALTVGHDHTIAEALFALTKKDVEAALIVDDEGKVCGLFDAKVLVKFYTEWWQASNASLEGDRTLSEMKKMYRAGKHQHYDGWGKGFSVLHMLLWQLRNSASAGVKLETLADCISKAELAFEESYVHEDDDLLNVNARLTAEALEPSKADPHSKVLDIFTFKTKKDEYARFRELENESLVEEEGSIVRKVMSLHHKNSGDGSSVGGSSIAESKANMASSAVSLKKHADDGSDDTNTTPQKKSRMKKRRNAKKLESNLTTPASKAKKVGKGKSKGKGRGKVKQNSPPKLTNAEIRAIRKKQEATKQEAKNAALKEAKADWFWRHNAVCPEDHIRQALHLMQDKKVTKVFIIDDTTLEPVGVMNLLDICRYIITNEGETKSKEYQAYRNTKKEDVVIRMQDDKRF